MRRKEKEYQNVKDLERLLLLEVAPKVTKVFWVELINGEQNESLRQIFTTRLDRAQLIHEAGAAFMKRALNLAEQKNIIKPFKKVL